jgi:hypothetical protein
VNQDECKHVYIYDAMFCSMPPITSFKCISCGHRRSVVSTLRTPTFTDEQIDQMQKARASRDDNEPAYKVSTGPSYQPRKGSNMRETVK